MQTIFGSCLCGAVTFKCDNSFEKFYFCHCEQCQKITGSAHASNLYTSPQNIEWLTGPSLISRYDLPGRIITSSFFSQCGAPVPYISKSGKALIVPAGSLDSEPNLSVQANIFWSEHSSWYEEGLASWKFDKYAG